MAELAREPRLAPRPEEPAAWWEEKQGRALGIVRTGEGHILHPLQPRMAVDLCQMPCFLGLSFPI